MQFKRKVSRIILAGMLFFCATISPADASDYTFAKGDGSQSNPFQISSADDLVGLSADSSYWDRGYYFIQTADIDMIGREFTPIGNADTSFTGTYNGQGYTISNINISSTELAYAGFLGYAQNGDTLLNWE